MKRLLLVEDNPLVARITSKVLESDGYHVDVAADGEEALNKARQNPPSMVISDILMPVMDGFTLCREWKKDARLSSIPFVFYTATYTDARDEELALSLGAEGFIRKPSDPNEFLSALRQILSTHMRGSLVRRQPEVEEQAFYRLYNEALIRKLEDKMIQVQEENRALVAEIARRTQIEEELRRAQQYWESIFQAIGQPAFILDNQHRILRANLAAQIVTGIAEREMIGRFCFEVLHNAESPPYACPLEATLLSGTVAGQEAEMAMLGRTFLVSCAPIAVPGSTSERFIHIATDITELRDAQEALRASEEKLRSLFDSLADGVIVTDLDGQIVEVNDAVLRILGLEAKGEILEENILTFFAEKDRERVRGSLSQVSKFASPLGGEFTGLRRNGSEFPAEFGVSLLRDSDGKPAGYVAIVKDISVRKRLEQQLLQAQKMEVVGRLAGGIAHDFNNILTAISGYGSFVLEALPPGSAARADAEQMLRSVSKAADLTRQLLMFSRRAVVAPRVIDLNELIMDISKMLRRLIGEHIELVTLPGPNLGLVRADPGQIEQIIVNLAVNARDAMPNGGTLTLETANIVLDEAYAETHLDAKPGSYVMLSISDTGIGMTEEVKAHLFEPFFTTKEPGKGTGLGLATVYGIVKQHGGSIYVYSEPQKGTVFKIYFPRVDEPREELPLRDEEGYLPGGVETILLAEDEPLVRQVMVRTLRQLGYTVLEAGTGEEALRIARSRAASIHLLITDLIMPQMGGRELAATLLRENPSLRVLYISGYTDDTVMRSGIMDEAVNFLQKPFTSASLARKVRAVLDLR